MAEKPPPIALDKGLPQGAFARLGSLRFVIPWGKASAIALSPDGKRVASVGNAINHEGVYIWDADTGGYVDVRGSSSEHFLIWSQAGHLAGMNWNGEFWIGGGGGRLVRLRKPEMTPSIVTAMRIIDKDNLLAIAVRPSTDGRDGKGQGWGVELWGFASAKPSRVWNADDGGKRALLEGLGESYQFSQVSLSPLGGRMAWLASPGLASPEADKREGETEKNGCVVFVFDTVSGKLLHTVKNLPRTMNVNMADEGKTLVIHPMRPDKVDRIVTRNGSVVDVASGLRRFHYEHRFLPPYSYVEFGDPGRVRISNWAIRYRHGLLTVDDVGLVRWDPETGKRLDECNVTLYYGMSNFTISGDGRRIAIGEGSRVIVSDGDLESLRRNTEFFHWPAIQFLANGRLVGRSDSRGFGVGSAGSQIIVWNVREQKVLESHWLYPWPEDSSARDSMFGMVRTHGHSEGEKFGHKVRDGLRNEPLYTLWDVGHLAYPSGDGKRLLCYEYDKERLVVRWFDARNGKKLGEYEAPHVADARMIRNHHDLHWFAGDGSTFGYVNKKHELILVDCAKAKVRAKVRLAVDAASEWPLWTYHNAGFDRLVFARPLELKLVKDFAVWDRQGNSLRAFTLPLSKDHDYRSLCLSSDGRMVTKLEDTGRVLSLYETATARKRGQIELPHELVGAVFEKSVSFSPDGKVLATSGPDTTILLWDLARPLSGKKAMPPPRDPEEARRLWDMLGHPDPTESDRALWTLVREPEHVYRLSREGLDVFKRPDPGRVQALIEQLRSKDIKGRESASQQLLKMNHSILPALREARKGATLEVELRLDGVIKQQEARQAHARLREIRILEVLERIGTPEARGLVEAVADRPDAEANTHEARLILARWDEVQRATK